MNKICTSIEQSQKLIELGVDINTADMYYPNRIGIDNYPLPIEWKNGLRLLSQEIPAWSLSALLELIPLHLKEFKNGIDFEFSKAMNNKKWYSAHYTKFSDKGLANFDKTITGDTAVDAVFEMICWLKENKKI